MPTTMTTYYLQMLAPDALRPARPHADLALRRAAIASPDLSRFLYASVGSGWYWIERLSWSYQQWIEYLARPELEVWVGYLGGNPVGYLELERQDGGDCEIAYFGLLPQFIGQGLGGALLSEGVRQAWQGDTKRVWLHTCSLDGPHALANYQARGFEIYDKEEDEVELPPSSPQAWPE